MNLDTLILAQEEVVYRLNFELDHSSSDASIEYLEPALQNANWVLEDLKRIRASYGIVLNV